MGMGTGGARSPPLLPAPRSGRCSSTASRWRAGGRSWCPCAPSPTKAWPSAAATWSPPSPPVRLERSGGSRGGGWHRLTPPCPLSVPPPGPAFTHAWVPEARTIEVAVPEGPALMVRLCHQLALECEELPRPFHRQVLVPGGHRISLPYEFLVPCLCIEVCHCPVGSWGLSACPCSEGTRVAGTRHPLTALLPSPGLLPAA
uniref:Uncharacterized protein n=1 Tax=Anas platyrhynchos platyrhynchos TaxID=8840 RepID=A0A493TKV1_ANAPP